MAWYWWVLIGIGCVSLYVLKVVLLKHWLKKNKIKKELQERSLEDD